MVLQENVKGEPLNQMHTEWADGSSSTEIQLLVFFTAITSLVVAGTRPALQLMFIMRLKFYTVKFVQNANVLYR